MLGLISFIAVVVLAVIVSRQQRRIKTLERDLDGLRKAVPAHPGNEPQEATVGTAAPLERLSGDATSSEARDVAPGSEIPAAESPAREELGKAEFPAEQGVGPAARTRAPDIETALGTRWAVWVGGLALALGGIFLVRYSIEAGIFGPGVRLAMAAVLGSALAAGGEFVRRTGFRVPAEGLQRAYVPAVLTAAGAFTLFGTTYAAHGIYGFIGPAAAFVLLGVIGVATIVAALLHGQSLAGIGLLGSYMAPLLVASEAPNHWALFLFVAVVLVSTAAIARLRNWAPLMASAFAGAGIWAVVYLVGAPEIELSILIFINAVTLGTLAFIWLGGRTVPRPSTIGKGIDGPSIAPAVFVPVTAFLLFAFPSVRETGGMAVATLSIAALIATALYRAPALPTLFGGGVASVLAYAYVAFGGSAEFELFTGGLAIEQNPAGLFSTAAIRYGALLGAVFVASGFWKASRLVGSDGFRAAAWMACAVIVSLVILAALWFAFGNPDRDYVYALVAFVLAAIFAIGADWIGRAEVPPLHGGPAVSFGLAGATAAALIAIHMAFGGGMTTVLAGALVPLPALATRFRSYPALGWLSVAIAATIVGRIAFDPTIVGAEFIGTTPVFNWLLPGYGVPALTCGYAAWQLADRPGGRPRFAVEAFAALFGLVGIAMLVRHLMNGGIIYAGAPTLAEQSIYTLIALGGGAVVLALDRRSPSPVFRYGSLALGVLSVAFIVIQHFANLNPLRTDESTGRVPVLNLLLLGYFLPGAAMGALAWYARRARPRWYVAMLALVASLLGFTYATLSVRRLFHGEFIGLWKGLSQLETYSYSALWLALGVALLSLGVRLNSHLLRIASAGLVVVAVAKVFLFDMSELEGVLRALSFIGLGAVLIGIGLFYQRMLASAAK
ncbi:MAG TPA: DUF2339 domain-containing protein [Rhizobiaceae bacterium]|nr:DUF2339 domain-containing protein [Rhizobiaceae bacterium]